jgi:predicted AlkP superfamily pyrophosphatase or phosphodiesterase
VPLHQLTSHFLVVMLLVSGIAPLFSCQRAQAWHGEQKLIILGIDGMDPQLLKQFISEGRMPNFARLSEKGSFR